MSYTIVFKPTFSHKPWVDTVDRVAAGGDNGFNVRFQAIEADLDALSARFVDVSNALTAIAPTVPAYTLVNVNPSMNPALPTDQWIFLNGESHKGGSTTVKGIIPLAALPSRGRVNTVRVTGLTTGAANVSVSLYRKPFGGQASEVVAQLTTIKSPTPTTGDGRYDIYIPSQDARAAIDSANYTYYLEIIGTGDNTNDAFVTGIQILVQP